MGFDPDADDFRSINELFSLKKELASVLVKVSSHFIC